MIKLQSKSISPAIGAIKKMPNVKKVFTMTGQFDLLVEFEGETTGELHDFHFELDGLDGIEGVITNVVMKEFTPGNA